MYKLPDLTKHTDYMKTKILLLMLLSIKPPRESHKLDYYEKLGGNKNPNQEIITNGYYYDKFFISRK